MKKRYLLYFVVILSVLALFITFFVNENMFTDSIPYAVSETNSSNEVSTIFEAGGNYDVEIEATSDIGFDGNNIDTEEVSNENLEEKKIIITSNAAMKTNSYNETYDIIKKILDEVGGFISFSNSENVIPSKYMYEGFDQEEGIINGNIQIKIPVKLYDSVKNRIFSLGKITSLNEEMLDSTDVYNDINLTLQLKKEEENRLMVFLEQAITIEEKLIIEDRLVNVREVLEYNQAIKQNIERLSSYSTINLEIYEDKNFNVNEKEYSFDKKFREAINYSIESTKLFFENLIVGIALLSFPIMIVVFLIIFVIGIKKLKKAKL